MPQPTASPVLSIAFGEHDEQLPFLQFNGGYRASSMICQAMRSILETTEDLSLYRAWLGCGRRTLERRVLIPPAGCRR